MFSIHIKSTFIILLSLTICACSSATARHPSDISGTKTKKINPARIAKKLLIVMPEADYSELDYRFLGTDPSLRAMLDNEAELAAIIAYDLAITSNSGEVAVDELALQTLAYAGYNPMAAINLQNRIIATKDSSENDWQLGPFNQYNLSPETIANNKKIVATLPSGLTMGAKL